MTTSPATRLTRMAKVGLLDGTSRGLARLIWPAHAAAWAQGGLMHVVVLFESLFGNTNEVAEAIADGVRTADPAAEVACVRGA